MEKPPFQVTFAKLSTRQLTSEIDKGQFKFRSVLNARGAERKLKAPMRTGFYGQIEAEQILSSKNGMNRRGAAFIGSFRRAPFRHYYLVCLFLPPFFITNLCWLKNICTTVKRPHKPNSTLSLSYGSAYFYRILQFLVGLALLALYVL